MNFTEEEKEVIEEFVTRAKSKEFIIRVSDVEKGMTYNFHHGKGASYELLFNALPFIKENYDLTDKEYAYLQKESKTRFKYDINSWEYSKDRPKVKPDMIVSQGEGYMIIEGGFRVDYGHDWYEHLREQFKKTGVYDPGLR